MKEPAYYPRKTAAGIIVNQRCGDTIKACYYRDGNYPDLPKNWKAIVNDPDVTASMMWFHEIENYRPDRVYNWMD